jgi:choline dehydrogenase
VIWDYIIVGAGSAGCAAAHELAKTGDSVLILEAGGPDRSLDIKLPSAVGRACAKYDWGYVSEPDPTRGGTVERWLRGKVVGGSSSINGTKYVRPAAADFERWSELCGHGGRWSATELMPLFRDMERSDQAGIFRGKQGVLAVRTVLRPHPVTRAFVEAAAAAGYPYNPDYNGESQEGVAYAQFSQRRGFRCSSADAFLRPILRLANVTLLHHAFVEKIEFLQKRATAVIVRHKETLRREVGRHIVSCAGAINSPKLLLLSGIGPAQELARLGIAVVHDAPQVGHHFQDQQFVRLMFRSRVPTYNMIGGLLKKARIATEFLLFGEGPISNIFEGMAIVRSSPGRREPDIRLTFLALGLEESKLAPYPAVMVSLMTSYPQSSGRIYMRSADPSAAPVIDYPLFSQPEDLETMVRGVRIIRQIMKTTPVAEMLAEEVTPGATVNSEEAVREFVRNHAGVAYHSIGSCRMGIDPHAPVTPELRVRGIDNLWVADASIMPTHISADTNATSMMIGLKCGRQLAEQRAARKQ